MELSSLFPLSLYHVCVSWIASQLQPKHCADTISAARRRKQKKQMPKKGEVQKEKPGAESLRKDRTIFTTSVFFFVVVVLIFTDDHHQSLKILIQPKSKSQCVIIMKLGVERSISHYC